MHEPYVMQDSYMWLFNNTNFCDKKWEIIRGIGTCVATDWNTRKVFNIFNQYDHITTNF